MDKISPALMFLEGLMGFPPSFTWFLWHASVARVRVLNILVAHNHRSTLTACNSSSDILFYGEDTGEQSQFKALLSP